MDISTQECEDVLAANHYAHLGCIDGDEPYVVPITYVYRDGFLYGCTQEGRKVDSMRKHGKVCLQVERIADANDWVSVMCWGHFEEVKEPKSRKDIKFLLAEEHGKLIKDKRISMMSGVVEHLHDEDASQHEVVYRIKPYRITGRAEKA